MKNFLTFQFAKHIDKKQKAGFSSIELLLM
ncbi:hypothetical protein LI6934_21320 [Bacillus licheniformis LMG 6934]|nr:hypothetical protein LI6934_21320 [Bacillus licheniformis LMG 6934]